MGYLISGHFLKQEPDMVAVRAALPPSLGCRAFRHRGLELFAIDTYRANKPKRWPLATATPATDLPLELPASLAALTAVYERLLKEGGANGLKRAYINLSALLSGVLGQPVLTLYADDDGNDFACLSRSRELVSLVARCAAYRVRYEQGRVSLEPAPEDHLLHELAAEGLRQWFGVDGAELGLGSFDPPEVYGFVECSPPSEGG